MWRGGLGGRAGTVQRSLETSCSRGVEARGRAKTAGDDEAARRRVVLALPPSEFLSRKVSLESRKGT